MSKPPQYKIYLDPAATTPQEFTSSGGGFTWVYPQANSQVTEAAPEVEKAQAVYTACPQCGTACKGVMGKVFGFHCADCHYTFGV
jgi:hypothetical protein